MTALTGSLVLAAVVGGCSMLTRPVEEVRYFDVVLPEAGEAGAVPVRVSDVTRTVTSVAIDIRQPPVAGGEQAFVAAVEGQPNAVVVAWPGGTCDDAVALDLSPGVGGQPVFTLKLLARQGGCMLDVVPRRLVVTFEMPVDARAFRLDVVR